MTTPLIETLKREAREMLIVPSMLDRRIDDEHRYKIMDTLITTTARKVLEAVREGVPAKIFISGEYPFDKQMAYSSHNMAIDEVLTHIEKLLAPLTKTE